MSPSTSGEEHRVRKALPTLLEVAFVSVFVAGVALIYLPAGLMVAGVLGVLAVERRPK
jgi:hypothetical protein